MTAIILDFDGVVLDSQWLHADIESKMLVEYNIFIPPDEISRRFAGMSLRDQFATLFTEVGRPSPYTKELSDRKAALFIERLHEADPIEGTFAFIEKNHGRMPLAIASATRNETLELALNMHNIGDRFKAIASSREVKRGKPAPDVFLLAAERLGVAPKDCVVIEDGVNGMIGARAAKMRCIALDREGTRKYPADLIVRDLREVPDTFFE